MYEGCCICKIQLAEITNLNKISFAGVVAHSDSRGREALVEGFGTITSGDNVIQISPRRITVNKEELPSGDFSTEMILTPTGRLLNAHY